MESTRLQLAVQVAFCAANDFLADKGYDADWFREALLDKGIKPCIPSKKNRKQAIPHDKKLYKQRHKVEDMFGRLRDWRRISTRYDRCSHAFFSASCFSEIYPNTLSNAVYSLEHFSSCNCANCFQDLKQTGNFDASS